LKHRGPDGGGTWADAEIFLGHRRLSIIDLNSGSQPMFSHDKRYVITFNGEIYNYRELRAELEGYGHRFITASDTEVILEAYRCWGLAGLEHIEGIFAFVLWDRELKTLLAARDRLGIKPLCWSSGSGYLIFSSTLEPLFQLPDLTRQLDYEALRNVLVFDYIPTPQTILKNVQKLPPGSYLLWKPEHSLPKIQSYWQVPSERKLSHSLSRADMAEHVEQTLEKAIVRQMVSDVPLGAFLSGGIDSSLLVALMSRHSSTPVKTFSISFQGEEYDESSFANEVASQYGTEHTVFPSEEITGSQMIDIVSRLDEPFADPALIPTFALSALTREHVTVALSGDGGDEVFGGYPKYLCGEDKRKSSWLPWARPLKRFMHAIPLRPRGADRLYWRTLNAREQVRYSMTHYGDYPVFRKDLRQVLVAQVIEQAHIKDFLVPWERQANLWGTTYSTDLLMRTDLTTYLSENCLVKTDRMSMLNSLEVRVPFLDEMMVNEVVPLPAEWKIQSGELKSLLIPLAKKLLPRSVWQRPKHGFHMPLGRSLGSVWQAEVDEMLDWGPTHLPLFNYAYLNKLNRINHRTSSIGRELWTPLVVLIWCHKHYSEITF
jgi:asparagine synthase (glutamine-hydrolysing)